MSESKQIRTVDAAYITRPTPKQAEIDYALERLRQPASTGSEWVDVVGFIEFARSLGYQPTPHGCAFYVMGSRREVAP